MGDRGGEPCCGLLGEARGRRGWIKGPPVLQGMINDLQISGANLFDSAALMDSRQGSDSRVSICVKREKRVDEG